MRQIIVVQDADAWIQCRRRDTEQALKFKSELYKRFEYGTILGDMNPTDGSYAVQVADRVAPYDKVWPISQGAYFQDGDACTLGFHCDVPGIPEIISKGRQMIVPEGTQQTILLAGLWIQGGADEGVDSYSPLANGIWVPTALGIAPPTVSNLWTPWTQPGGPVPTVFFALPATAQTENPEGVIAFTGADNNSYLAVLSRDPNLVDNAPDGTNSMLTLHLFPNLATTKAYSVPVAKVPYRTLLNNDTGLNYGFLFADRATGLVYVMGSADQQQNMYVVDPIAKTSIGFAMGYSMHQASMGFGFVVKTWITTFPNSPTLYPQDRTQQDNVWRAWQYTPPAGETPGQINNLWTIDPSTLFPVGSQLMSTRAKNIVEGLAVGSEEGRNPICLAPNPAPPPAATTIATVVGYVSSIQFPTNPTLQDCWMNAGFPYSVWNYSGGGPLGEYPVTGATLLSGITNLTGGHRAQNAQFIYVPLSANPTITTCSLPTNTPNPVQDAASVSAWSNYYTALANNHTSGNGMSDVANLIGEAWSEQWGGLDNPGLPGSNLTLKGVAPHLSLYIGNGVKYVPVLQETLSSAPCVPSQINNGAAPGTFWINITGLSTPGDILSTAVDQSGANPDATLQFPDYQYFPGGHQLACPHDNWDADTVVVEWPLNTATSLDFIQFDPIESEVIDSTNRTWNVVIQPYTNLEGGGPLIPQYNGGTTLTSSSTTDNTQCVDPGDGSSEVWTGQGGTVTGPFSVTENTYVANFDIWQTLNVVQYGQTFLVCADPSSGQTTQYDISNWLSGYLVDGPAETTVTSSLMKNPLDSTLWKPILIESQGCLAILRMWRDTLNPGTLGTEQIGYPVIEFRIFNGPNNVMQRFALPENTATIVQATTGNTVRLWDWFQGSPVIVKSTATSDGLPCINIFMQGVMNKTDGTSIQVNILWQFLWNVQPSGNPTLPQVQNIFFLPADYQHPTNPQEIGSICIAGGQLIWTSQASDIPGGGLFAVMAQALT